jgi:hypothetical protein
MSHELAAVLARLRAERPNLPARPDLWLAGLPAFLARWAPLIGVTVLLSACALPPESPASAVLRREDCLEYGAVDVRTVPLAAHLQVDATAPPTRQPVPQGPPLQQSASAQQVNAGADSGSFRRREIVYVNVEAGGAYVNTGYDGGYAPSSQSGLAVGVGGGFRFHAFTFGVRTRLSPLSAFTLVQANLEAGFHLSLGAWDPYVGVHSGYTEVPMKPAATFGGGPVVIFTPSTSTGVDLGGSLGLDYYLTSLFSLGVDAALDALFLNTGNSFLQRVLYENGGSSTGVFAFGSLHAGFHFDL